MFMSQTREEQIKLNDKSERFIFIDYDSSAKGQKLYNPNNKKMVISRDAVFDEEGQWDFETHENQGWEQARPGQALKGLSLAYD